jgi:DNA-directed RNA polymerase subunit RPC12/RpoP
MKNNRPDQLPNHFNALTRKCRYYASAHALIVQVSEKDIPCTQEVTTMRKPRIPCPKCGSELTFKTAGPYAVSSTLTQQRYKCEDCGQRFLASWQVVGIRPYDSPTVDQLVAAGA